MTSTIQATDFFFEVPSAEIAVTTLKALAQATPSRILTGLHYLDKGNPRAYFAGASFSSPMSLETVRLAIGTTPRPTELTLPEVMRRASSGEFATAIFGDASRILGLEGKTDTRRSPTSEDVDAR